MFGRIALVPAILAVLVTFASTQGTGQERAPGALPEGLRRLSHDSYSYEFHFENVGFSGGAESAVEEPRLTALRRLVDEHLRGVPVRGELEELFERCWGGPSRRGPPSARRRPRAGRRWRRITPSPSQAARVS